MTVQQQVAARVLNLSDEEAKLVEQLLNSLNPLLFTENEPARETINKVDVSRRFGAGKGIIRNTDEFDSFNNEIAELFMGFDV